MITFTLLAQAGPSALSQLPILIGVIAVFYFLLIRPQQKQEAQAKEFRNSLRVGDRVITSAGMYVKVVSLDDETVQVELARGVKVRMLRSEIALKQTEEIISED